MQVAGGADGPHGGVRLQHTFRSYCSRDKHISVQWSEGLSLLPDYRGEKGEAPSRDGG